MHAFLIVGSSPEKRFRQAQELASNRGVGDTPDVSYRVRDTTPQQSITIAAVRDLQHWVAQASNQPRAAWILEAQRLTSPAQHALLKTLEEPPEPLTIILTADSEESLLPTIRSRCRTTRLSGKDFVSSPRDRWLSIQSLVEPSTQSPSLKILALYEQLSKFTNKSVSPHQGSIQRADALKFVEQLVSLLHQQINFQPCPSGSPRWSSVEAGRRVSTLNFQLLARALREATIAHRRLQQNLNPNLVLQQFVLDTIASN